MKRAEIITPQHTEGIGEVMVSWAILEYQVLKAFRGLLGPGRSETMVLFWHMSFKERTARLGALVGLQHEDANDAVRREFDTLLTRMQFMEEIRNIVAHSTWAKGTKPDAITPFLLKAKSAAIKFSGKGMKMEQFTPERLLNESKKIERLAQDVKHFFAAHFPEPTEEEKEPAN
jgi:hypothetical protein